MVYRGRVKDGVVVLDDPAALPEGTVVFVEPAEPAESPEPELPKTLLERFSDIIGSVPDLPEDLAKNHDHYLYGMPKK
jgi:hypothetical protein